MLNIKIYATGSIKEQYYRDAIAEYRKRLGAFCRLEIIEFKEYRISDEPSEREIEQALAAEGRAILSKLAATPRAYRIAMCVEGRELSSEEFAARLEDISATHGELAIIIGSSWGLSPEVKAACNLRLSVSRMTLTHQMLRVWLLEILYRCLSISRGGKYHK